jgi:hypothetical protein
VDVNKNLKLDYAEAAEIGESVGLKVGAKFKTPDYPHYEEPTDYVVTSEIKKVNEPQPELKYSGSTGSIEDFIKELFRTLFRY